MKEFRLYLSHLTFRRVVNLALCGIGYTFSRLFSKPIVLGMPYSVSLEPTTRCNLLCPECPTGNGTLNRPLGDMGISLFKNIINQISPYTTTVLLHFQGEPLLNARIVDMVKYATSKRIITEIATNATLITYPLASNLIKAGIKKIVVSLDSPIEQEFGYYRKGAKLSGVLEGVKNIIEARDLSGQPYPIVVLEMLAFKKNINDIDKFIELGRQLNIDKLRVKSVQVSSGKEGFKEIPVNSIYSRYKMDVDGTYSLKNYQNKTCPNPWFKLSIYHNGTVVPCCFDKSGIHVLGNANDLKNVWKSKKYNDFRCRLILNRNGIPLCSQCPQGRVKLDFDLN